MNFVDPDGRDGMVIGSGTEADPYVIVVCFFYNPSEIGADQIDGLKAAANDYNNSLTVVKDSFGNKQYVTFSISIQASENIDYAMSKTCFTDINGNTRNYGNYIKVSNSNAEGIYGYATNRGIYFNVGLINEAVIGGMSPIELNKGVSIHEIGHNLGGIHEDKTGVMEEVETVISLSPVRAQSIYYSYPSFDRAFVKKIFNRRDTGTFGLWTKKLEP